MKSIDEIYQELLNPENDPLPTRTDEEWDRLHAQHKAAEQRFQMEPMPVTECNTCGEVSLMWRLGCAHRACPAQPVSADVNHMLATNAGFLLRPGIDFMWLEEKPTSETDDEP